MENENFIMRTKDPESRWAAFTFKGEYVSEGKTPEEANKKAKELVGDNNYVLSWMPDPNVTYIF